MNIPDNAFWYHTAYTVVVVIYAAYVASLWWRRRALRDEALRPEV